MKLPTVIPFGKYRGRPFAQVAAEDPYYLDWLIVTPSISLPVQEAAQNALSSSKLKQPPAPQGRRPAPHKGRCG